MGRYTLADRIPPKKNTSLNSYVSRTNTIYSKIAAKKPYLNEAIVQEVYEELLLLVVEELKRDYVSSLPMLGVFKLSILPPRMAWSNQKKCMVPAGQLLRVVFTINRKMKKYFKELGQEKNFTPEMMEKKIKTFPLDASVVNIYKGNK